MIGARRRDQGAARALEAEARKEDILAAIKRLAKTCRVFDSDQVWEVLAKKGIHKLHHPNAMGGAFLAAQAEGVIEPTDEVRHSNRPVANRRKVTLWRSLVTA